MFPLKVGLGFVFLLSFLTSFPALNTLDLLKKTSKSAREASRILEKEVGSNPRIRVQQDDAFVLWDKIDFAPTTDAEPSPSPEWVRRTICSARWEFEHATATLALPNAKVVVAISAPPPATGRAERANGTLVALWAKRAGVQLLELAPTPWNGGTGGGHGRKSSDEDTAPRALFKRGGDLPRKDLRKDPVSPVRRREREERHPLVERIPAPTKVIRVLARGEKLDDTP